MNIMIPRDRHRLSQLFTNSFVILNFVLKNINIVQEPILEAGSKDHGNMQDFRSLFPTCEYFGIDMEEGKGVDMVNMIGLRK